MIANEEYAAFLARFANLEAKAKRLEAKLARLEEAMPKPKPKFRRDIPKYAMERVQEIVRAVSAETGVPVRSIMSRSQTRAATWPRQEVMRRAIAAGLSTPVIGAAIGRDHTTVISGAKQAAKRMAAQ